MKKSIITSACAVVVSGVAFAQGTVNWNTITPTYMTAQTDGQTYSYVTGGGTTGGGSIGATPTTANGFYYELLYNTAGSQQSAPTTLSGLESWADAGLSAVNNTGTAGRLSTLNASTAAVVPWNSSTSDSIMLVGWSANLGTTWGTSTTVGTVLYELVNWASVGGGITGPAFFGQSNTGYIEPNTAPNTGATLWGSSANANGIPINSANTQLYELQATPEPGTLALAALGGASLLLFRRKK